MSPWHKLALLSVGGALGAVARVALGTWVQAATSRQPGVGTYFPWGTLSVNLLGCFAFGVVASALEEQDRGTAALRLLVLGGFLGAFTTFSTFIFDVVRLGETRFTPALANLVLHNLAGILVLLAGAALGRRL